MIIEDCKKKKKNLSMTWIDYRKAYDSVPHSWILKTLQIYRFNEKLIKFMRTSMSNWKTTMKLSYNDGCITTDQIKIKRGIFQGDSFSPLLFCLALVPLTSELATSGYGYKILNTNAPISNLFYMDDLKLYSKNEQEQVGELKIVKQFSDNIGMEFGLEKCAKASFMKGKLVSTGNIVIDDDTEIQELDQEGVYKYLGVDESDGIQHSKMKERIRKEYNRRVRLILRTELNGRNKIEAINSLAVPVVQYSFGIINWKISELKKIDTKTRKLLNMHKMLHPKADKWYEHVPETVIHNKDNNITIMWDMPVNTDRTITVNRPDIIVKDSVNSTCKLIDMTVPSDRNNALKETEKKCKYKDLELEIQRMWHMKTVVIPVVVGALGTVKKGMVENVKKVSERATMTEIQKICMLGSSRILRKVLSV